jgi:hypothetical protein
MRSFLIAIVVVSASISGAAAQQQPCNQRENIFGAMARGAGGPPAAAQHDFEVAVCEYKNCLAATPHHGRQRATAGHYNGSR